jgi:hypothetical protein
MLQIQEVEWHFPSFEFEKEKKELKIPTLQLNLFSQVQAKIEPLLLSLQLNSTNLRFFFEAVAISVVQSWTAMD